jgi:hypothetical protein
MKVVIRPGKKFNKITTSIWEYHRIKCADYVVIKKRVWYRRKQILQKVMVCIPFSCDGYTLLSTYYNNKS